MNFTKEWALAQIEKRKAEKDPQKSAEDKALTLWPYLAEEFPDLGLESNLQKRVLDYCKENGWPCFHDRSKKVNESGWPDNHIFLPGGKIVLIELKSSAGKLRKEQQELRRLLGWNDHMVYVAKSFKRDVEIIQRELKGE